MVCLRMNMIIIGVERAFRGRAVTLMSMLTQFDNINHARGFHAGREGQLRINELGGIRGIRHWMSSLGQAYAYAGD